MVVIIDFESDDEESFISPHRQSNFPFTRSHPVEAKLDQVVNDETSSLVPNRHTRLFTAVLSCYPAAFSICAHLDLNDLDSLSRTCRDINRRLGQSSHQLKAHSLQCVNDEAGKAVQEDEDVNQFVEDDQLQYALAAWNFSSIVSSLQPQPSWSLPAHLSPLGAKTKISTCARDLVAECRRCGVVICRNCTAKSPSDRAMKQRFRRLCRTCLDAPLSAHLLQLTKCQEHVDSPPASSASSTRSTRSISNSSAASTDPSLEEKILSNSTRYNFTASAFARDPCTCCSRGVYLCQPCGQNLKATDTTYQRVWTWRSRYSTHIGGGLGTGLGVGNQGQKCGRGEHCLESSGSEVCWVEIDCSDPGQDEASTSRTGTPLSERDHEQHSNKPGYFSQEIEGIGGVVKKKVKKRVKVGATVWEFEDERMSGNYLDREATGRERSWCGWCRRVCLGEHDRKLLSSRPAAAFDEDMDKGVSATWFVDPCL